MTITKDTPESFVTCMRMRFYSNFLRLYAVICGIIANTNLAFRFKRYEQRKNGGYRLCGGFEMSEMYNKNDMREEKAIRNENTKQILQSVYKCGKMGSDSSVNLMKKVTSDELKSDMTSVLNGYQKFATNSAEQLRSIGEDPKEESPITQIGAKIGMAMNTMMDSSPSHIAEMVIQGANMGITELQGVLNRFEGVPCDDTAVDMVKGSIRYNEKVIEDMKKYLG